MRGQRLATIGLLLALAAGAAGARPLPADFPASGMFRRLDGADRDHLRQLEESARRAPAGEAEARWWQAATFALDHATSLDLPDDDDPAVTRVLREAGKRLPARTLAAIAARAPHPEVSAAFLRALPRTPGWTRAEADAEAAAEARDGLARFGAARGRGLLAALRPEATLTPWAGGAQRSVYAIAVVGVTGADSGAAGFAVLAGVRAGVAAAAGAWQERFEVRAAGATDEAYPAAFDAVVDARTGHPGTVILADGVHAATAWWTKGIADGVVVIDARPVDHEGIERRLGPPFRELHVTATGEVDTVWLRPGPLEPDLSYRGSFALDGAAALLAQRSFLARPHAQERGRRLAQAFLARPGAGTVAIAIPDHGGDTGLADAFEGVLRLAGRGCVRLEYAAGRRDFAPEVRGFVASGASHLLLAGPAEESAEWIAALARAKLTPSLLGSAELDPAGFHAGTRARLEGARFVGEDWEDRDAPRLARMAAAAESMGVAEGSDFRRGYRVGFSVARAVVEGAFTPRTLSLALRLHCLPFGLDHFLAPAILLGPGDVRARLPGDVAVPLYEVKGGEARRLDL